MMSDNENEKRDTVADVVAIVRRAAQYYEGEAEQSEGLLRETFKLSADNYREIADRIEAAWKRERTEIEAQALSIGGIVEASRHKPFARRETPNTVHNPVSVPQMVGNAAALREALVKCREIALQWQADEADGVAGTTDKPQARSAAEAVIDMEFEINAALSAPARNCDRFSDETDAQIAFLNEVWLISVTKETALERDRFENWTDEMKSRYANWLLAPAAERKGEGK